MTIRASPWEVEPHFAPKHGKQTLQLLRYSAIVRNSKISTVTFLQFQVLSCYFARSAFRGDTRDAVRRSKSGPLTGDLTEKPCLSAQIAEGCDREAKVQARELSANALSQVLATETKPIGPRSTR